MAKRLSSSQSNTLLNYFQSPKSKTPAKIETKKVNDDDDDEVVRPKKRNQSNIIDSDSDSENIPQQQLKKPRVVDTDSNDDDCSPKKKAKTTVHSFSASTPGKSTSGILNKLGQDSKPYERSKPAFNLSNDDETVDARWEHETLPFLEPKNIRDGQGRKMGHPDYDARTLTVPTDYLNKLTPAMRQWWELKSQHMDCVLFFKVGKFYELYHMDASVGVKHLGFSYMKGKFAHSGFPESAYGKMAQALVELGFKVARVEQTETPDMMAERCKATRNNTKFDKVVKREICQISIKGACLYGAQLSEPTKPTPYYMIAISERITENQYRFGICFIDVSIGIFHLTKFTDDKHSSRLLTLLAQHTPALILTERRCLSAKTDDLIKRTFGNVRRDVLAPETQFYSPQKVYQELTEGCYFKESDKSDAVLPDVFKELYTDRTPNANFELTLRSLGACMWYLKDSEMDIQVLSMGQFEIYHPVDTVKTKIGNKRECMILDSISINNLNILGPSASLQKTMDYCSTPFGKRLFQQWLCRPLCDIEKIVERQKAVKEIYDNPQLLEKTRNVFEKMPDLERQLAKIHNFGNKYCATHHPDSRAILYEMKTYSKRKINDLLATLVAFRKAMDLPNIYSDCESRLLRKITQLPPKGMFVNLEEDLVFFDNAFDHEKAKADGKILPERGVDSDYDEVQETIAEIDADLDKYLEEQRTFFKCEVHYFGTDRKRYQLEIPESKSHKVDEDYTLEGAKKGSKPMKRYSTPTTRELLLRMQKAEAEKDKILKDLSRRIFEKFSDRYTQWEKVIQCMMMLDCLCSLASYAMNTSSEDICLPSLLPMSDNPVCVIENGRHPCINLENFVPNDVKFDGHSNVLILTGPNMGGKSTLMRQTILISIMAQIGGYVPASTCELSLVDRVFTRLGARDDFLKQQSTFLVELTEASCILQHVTVNSFVLLDELGRGTSTHDGTAIATAYVNKVREVNCRTIFATHYHTLVDYYKGQDHIYLGYMACMVENEGDPANERVTFLYKLEEGSCPKSYGFNVAKLAGMPVSLTDSAIKFASFLERRDAAPRFLKTLMGGDLSEIRKSIQSLKF